MADDYVEVYERISADPDDEPKYDWRRIDGSNGQVIATSGSQGYSEKVFCIRMARRLNPTQQIRIEDPNGGYVLPMEPTKE